MPIVKILFTALLLPLIACATVTAMSKKPSPIWKYYAFDGQRFVETAPAAGVTSIAVAEGMAPVIVQGQSRPAETPLPRGKGAVAGICYIQSAGGKLGGGGTGYAPCRSGSVPVTAAGQPVTTLPVDANGFFAAVLDEGAYRVGSAPAAREIRITSGATILAPLRAGKRMVD